MYMENSSTVMGGNTTSSDGISIMNANMIGESTSVMDDETVLVNQYFNGCTTSRMGDYAMHDMKIKSTVNEIAISNGITTPICKSNLMLSPKKKVSEFSLFSDLEDHFHKWKYGTLNIRSGKEKLGVQK